MILIKRTRSKWCSSLIIVAAIAVCSATGCAKKAATTANAQGVAESTPPPPGAPQLVGVGVHGKVKFELRFSPAAPKVGELFDVITLAGHATSSVAIQGAEVTTDATMPHHGHGMMTQPVHTELGGGAYRHEGFKMHMHGKWTFDVRLKKGALEDRFKAVWDQPPAAL